MRLRGWPRRASCQFSSNSVLCSSAQSSTICSALGGNAPERTPRLAQEYRSPPPKTKLMHFADRGRPVRARVCREQLFLGVKPLAGIEAARRGTLLTIIYYLHSIQALVTPD